VWNPSFDVAPAALIEGIITERGLVPKEGGAFQVRGAGARPACGQPGCLCCLLQLLGASAPAAAAAHTPSPAAPLQVRQFMAQHGLLLEGAEEGGAKGER
jgi:hypothetical protein